MKTGSPKSEDYICIRCRIPEELEEELCPLLEPWAVSGIEIHAQSEGDVEASIYLSASASGDVASAIRLLQEAGARQVEVGSVEAVDWLAEYRARTKPFDVGRRWWIDPHPDGQTPAPEGRQRIVIEPRMAFGTGGHESTQGVLRALEEIEVRGRQILDVGTGSGILAFAVESMGASSVVGIDVDTTAIGVAAETARLQEWLSEVSFVAGTIQCIAKLEFDIVMCNMITSIFLPLVDEVALRVARGGIVIFSGLLADEIPAVTAVLEDAGLPVRKRRVIGDWATLTSVADGSP